MTATQILNPRGSKHNLQNLHWLVSNPRKKCTRPLSKAVGSAAPSTPLPPPLEGLWRSRRASASHPIGPGEDAGGTNCACRRLSEGGTRRVWKFPRICLKKSFDFATTVWFACSVSNPTYTDSPSFSCATPASDMHLCEWSDQWFVFKIVWIQRFDGYVHKDYARRESSDDCKQTPTNPLRQSVYLPSEYFKKQCSHPSAHTDKITANFWWSLSLL